MTKKLKGEIVFHHWESGQLRSIDFDFVGLDKLIDLLVYSPGMANKDIEEERLFTADQVYWMLRNAITQPYQSLSLDKVEKFIHELISKVPDHPFGEVE